MKENKVPPLWSRRKYVQIDRKDIAFFKFILESYDNLAYLSVMDKYRAVLQIVYSPDTEEELSGVLAGLQKELNCRVLDTWSTEK